MGIRENIFEIKKSLPESVKLVAVSKFNDAEKVMQALEAGQNIFGENRIQEAAPKFDFIRSQGYLPELHIIGNLQRNKVKEAVRIASRIQSVDRVELVEEIEKQCAKINKTMEILFEIHTAEDSKSGFTSKEELFSLLQKFYDGLYPHIVTKGFMTMAPFVDDEKIIRESFKKTSAIQKEAANFFSKLDLRELSMGMTQDYKIAVEEGSTMVRIGTGIFGERNYSK